MNNIVNSILKISITGLAGLFLVSCSATQSRNHDFLSSYSGLKKSSSTSGKVVYKGDLSKLKNYNKIYFEEVKVYQPTEMAKKGIKQSDLNRLQNSFRSSLQAQARGTRFGVASAPGPQTLSLRAAITDIQPGDPKVFATGYVPYVGMAGSAVGAVTGRNPGAGSATVEAEIIDSVSRERFFAGIDQNAGSKLQAKEGMSRWGHIDKAVEEWSEGLREILMNAKP